MKSKSPTNDTLVVKLGIEYFTTSDTRRVNLLKVGVVYMYVIPYEPRQAKNSLQKLRNMKLSPRMLSHIELPGVWFFCGGFSYKQRFYERTTNVLARLRGCAGSPEPSLFAYPIKYVFA